MAIATVIQKTPVVAAVAMVAVLQDLCRQVSLQAAMVAQRRIRLLAEQVVVLILLAIMARMAQAAGAAALPQQHRMLVLAAMVATV